MTEQITNDVPIWRRLGRRGWLLIALVLTIGITISAFVLSRQEHLPVPPEGVAVFTKYRRIEVDAVFADSSESGYHGLRFVKLRTGEIVAPVIRVKYPQPVVFPWETRSRDVWDRIQVRLSKNDPFLELPDSEDAVGFIMLLSRVGRPGNLLENDPWRVWEFQGADIRRGTLEMPQFDDLGILTDRKDSQLLLQRKETAVAFRTQLNAMK